MGSVILNPDLLSVIAPLVIFPVILFRCGRPYVSQPGLGRVVYEWRLRVGPERSQWRPPRSPARTPPSGITAVNTPPGLSWIEYIIYLRYSTMAFFQVRRRAGRKGQTRQSGTSAQTHPLARACAKQRRNLRGLTFTPTARRQRLADATPRASSRQARR